MVRSSKDRRLQFLNDCAASAHRSVSRISYVGATYIRDTFGSALGVVRRRRNPTREAFFAKTTECGNKALVITKFAEDVVR